ncbi:MAG: hypothetical protein ACK456_00955 [Pseudanabaenaceae cyanobacterium]|jgi:hypothetical protein
MSQTGFGESATPDIPPHADPTATSDTHRPWTSSVHESFESNSLGKSNGLGWGAVADNITEGHYPQEPNRDVLQELSVCNQKCHQAYTLLQQAQEQLRLSQLVIQRQEALIANLQERIEQQDLIIKDSQASCDDLRDRLKRQQHHTSQLKAALERCLEKDTKEPNSAAMPSSWGITKLAEERIIPVVSEQNSTASVDQIPATITSAEAEPSLSVTSMTDADGFTDGLKVSAHGVTDHNLDQSLLAESASMSLGQSLGQNVQTIETPAVTVKNPFPPRLSAHNSTHKLSEQLLRNGVPELPKWQNPLHSYVDHTAELPASKSSAMALAPSITPVGSSEPEQTSQMSAHPAPLAMPQVNPPKFLQHLGEVASKEEPMGNGERGGLGTKRITMAAVQLPQFPPMRRR